MAPTRILGRIGDFARGLSGWRARLFAFACGCASALGFAPFDCVPLLLLGFAALVLLIDGARRSANPIRNAALAGWCFGFGQFLVGLHWVGFAFMVDPSKHEWQIPFVAVLFPGGLALFIAGACAAAAAIWRDGASRLFALTIAYAFAEWLRGHVLTGFPWNIPGYGWGASLAVMQSSALFGVYGLSLLTVMFGASLADLFERPPAWRLPLGMTLLFLAIYAGGALRLHEVASETVPGVRLRLVQPDIAQSDKYRPELVERNWERLIDLSEAPAKASPTLIVWPEAAPPFLLMRSPEALDEIRRLAGGRRALLTGALRAERRDDGMRYYNSFFAFGRDGRLSGVYDKFHLVPFGEYLPFENLLKRFGLTKIVGVAGSFATGDRPRTLDVSGAPPFGPLICYEILFPGQVVGARRPAWIVNVTDDSWFGPWAGPLQHLLVARMRAIEEGLPVARAANTGVSAIIDPLGRVRASLGLNHMGVIDSPLPARVAQPPYARNGDFGFWLMLLACALSAGLAGDVRLKR
ncbi:MAG TPA: apolipoprotein N-acyltransferase [Rhizomicrobium sp.]|nr:apolipoprotein N-acyltransferase [Rhizomicrobium sp.]